MAIIYWTDGAADGNFGTAGNWSGGVAPTAGDTAIINYGSRSITSGVDVSGTYTSGSLYVGPEFYGQIGTPAAQLKFGGTMTKIELNCLRAKSVNLFPAACTDLIVKACGRNDYSGYLYDGNVTRLHLLGCDNFRVGALANPTTIYAGNPESPGATVNAVIESGATITLVKQFGGYIINEAALTTYEGEGGTFEHRGTATGAITTASLRRARLLWRAANSTTGFTLGTLNMEGGVFDAADSVLKHIITTLNLWAGSAIVNGNWTVTTLNEYASVSAKYAGPAPGTRNTIVVPGGR